MVHKHPPINTGKCDGTNGENKINSSQTMQMKHTGMGDVGTRGDPASHNIIAVPAAAEQRIFFAVLKLACTDIPLFLRAQQLFFFSQTSNRRQSEGSWMLMGTICVWCLYQKTEL